jgi:WD40 repeat protein/type II secretory pathway predicted ATPase ExeA
VLLNFFGLREQPFDVTPNLGYFFPSSTHLEALASLLYGIESRRGFLGLIAKPGMGKTTLLFELLRRLRTSARTAFVAQTQIGPRDFLSCLLADLQVDTPGRDFFQMHRQLTEILIREAHSGRRLVLVIDEAQDLEEPVLEMVRILSNFETTSTKRMEIVMAGQPSLADKLAQPALVQLRQRISVVGRLKPLNDTETNEYIDYRLCTAGYGGGSLFTPEARALIATRSEGVPRNINHLCFNALSLGYSLGRRTIDLGIMEDVASSLEWGSWGEEQYGVGHPARQGVPAARLVVEQEWPLADSSLDPAVERPITGSRVPVPAQWDVPSSVASQRASEESAIREPVDWPRSSMRAEEGELGSPPVTPGLFYRLAANTTARARLAAAAAVLCSLLLLLFFGKHNHRLIRVASPAAIAPASRQAGPGRAAMGARGVEARKTVEAGRLQSSDRSLRAEAPPPTSSSRAKEGTAGGSDSVKLGAVRVEQGRSLTVNPSPQPGAGPAVPSPDLKTPGLEGHNTEVPSVTSPVLVIEEAPPGAQVFVDNQLTSSIDSGGQTRISTLAPGQHRLRLSLNGYRDYEQGIDLPAGHTSRVTAKLEPSELSILPEPPNVPSPGVAILTPPPAEPISVPIPEFVLDRTLKGHSSWVTAVAFSADGRRLASGSWDQTVKFWDVATGQGLSTIDSEIKGVEALAFSHDGHLLAAESSTNTVALWDAATGRAIRTLPGGEPLGLFLNAENWVYSIAFSPDSRWLASGVDNKTVRLWEVRTGRPVHDLAGLRRSVICIAFSPDGRWLASGGGDKTIEIWEVATGQEMRRLSGHKKDVYAVAFSPDGRWLASASGDKSVKLWDATTGREVHTLEGHRKPVTSLAFSPDGRWLASGSWDTTIKIWDVVTGHEEQTLAGHTHHVYTVAVDSSGRTLASGSEDGTIKLWRLRRPVERSTR